MSTMLEQIETALNAKGFITNVSIEGNIVVFCQNGVWYNAKLVRGRFKAGNMRRAI